MADARHIFLTRIVDWLPHILRMLVSYLNNSLQFREMMVIVQMGIRYSRTTEYIKTNELKSYQANTRDPYVTAYLKTDELPLDFVIGDGKEYNFGKRKYANKPLKQNSSYITFLRFFESEVK